MKEFLGKKTLLVGDVGSGKTSFLAEFLKYLIENNYSDDVTVIDIAPARIQGIGGAIRDYTDYVSRIRYLRSERIWAPRLIGKNREEVLRYAEENRTNIEPLINVYLSNPSRILLMNDLTIYLHAGDVERVLELMNTAETFMATAYEGIRLEEDKNSGITERERRLLNILKEKADIVKKF
ncbi:MAG: hypothetical protein QW724_04495 [Nitrososphaerota archaeon]